AARLERWPNLRAHHERVEPGSPALRSCPSSHAATRDRLRQSGPMSRASGDCRLSDTRGVGCGRQRNAKRAAAARLALDRHAAAMCPRDELHNTQSEPAASAFAGEALIDLIE